MKTTYQDRLKAILDYKQWSGNQLAKEIGIKNTSIYKILRGDATPGGLMIEKICLALPEMNPVWFVLGAGDMLKQERAAVVMINDPNQLRRYVQKLIQQKAIITPDSMEPILQYLNEVTHSNFQLADAVIKLRTHLEKGAEVNS